MIRIAPITLKEAKHKWEITFANKLRKEKNDTERRTARRH